MTDDKDIVVVGSGGGESPSLRGVMRALEDAGHQFHYILDIEGIGRRKVGLLPPTFKPEHILGVDYSSIELRNMATLGWPEFINGLRKDVANEAREYRDMVCIIAALARVWRRR